MGNKRTPSRIRFWQKVVRPAAALIERLSEELGFQFLIVTHSEELKVGEVVTL